MQTNDFLRLASFGTAVENKKATLDLTARQKKAIYGSPQEQRVLATAQANGNSLADTVGMRDLQELDTLEFAQKYGLEAALERVSYDRARYDLRQLENADRTTGELATDSLIGSGLALTNMAGGLAVLGATATDQVLSAPSRLVNAFTGEETVPVPPPTSPVLAQGLNWINEQGRELQSDTLNQRRAQLDLANELDRMDREAQSEQRKEDGANPVLNWFQEQGKAVYDTVENYVEDPMMMTDLAPEGLASVAGFAGIIRGLARKGITAQLAKQGRSKADIAKFLKTNQGKAALNAEAERLAPGIIGAVESGSAITQTQQSIMGMSEEDLSESADYLALREDGLSHDQAKARLALTAGTNAGLVAAPIAIGAGKISAPFAANPLGVGSRGGTGSVFLNASRNIASETVEEFLQEGGSQFASNVGEVSVGLDTPLDQGVAEGAAVGALGGALSSGIMQTPGTAVRATREATRAAVKGVTAAISARDEQLERQADEESVVGSAEQAKAAEDFEANAAVLLTPKENEPTPEQVPLLSAIEGATFLSEEEAAQPFYADIERDEQNRVSRLGALARSTEVLKNAEAPTDAKVGAAIGIIQDYNAMRGIVSTEATAAVEALPENSTERAAYNNLLLDLETIESAQIREQAVEVLRELTPEQTAEIIPIELLEDPETAPEVREAITAAVAAIAQVNPEAIDAARYDVVLNQSAGNEDSYYRKVIKLSKKIAEVFKKADEDRQKIEDEQAEIPEERRYRTMDMVRDDILVAENAYNKLPSISQHRLIVLDAVASGNLDAVEDAMNDIRGFAQSQKNKAAAFSSAAAMAANGIETNAKSGVIYEAYGPRKAFFEQRDAERYQLGNGAWVNLNVPNSVALAREVFVDTEAVVNTYNSLLEQFGDLVGKGYKPIKMPEMDESLTTSLSAPIEGEPDRTKPPRRIRKDALAENQKLVITEEEPETATPKRTTQKRKARKRKSSLPLEGPLTEAELRNAERIQKPLKPREARPVSLKSYVVSLGGIWSGDPLIGEVRAMEYRRPGFIKRERLARSTAGDNNGGLTLDEMREAAAEAGYLPMDSTISDFLDLLREDVDGNTVVSEADLALQEEWDEYDNPDIENPETVALRLREQRREEEGLEGTGIDEETTREAEPEPQAEVTEETEETPQGDDTGGSLESSSDVDVIEEATVTEAVVEDVTEEVTEEVQEAAEAPSEAPVVTWLKNLKERVWQPGKVVNYFLQAFSAREEASTLTAHEDPGQFILDNLDALQTEANGMIRELTDAEKSFVQSLLTTALPRFAEQLRSDLVAVTKKKGWIGKTDKMNILNFEEAQALNFLVAKEDGKFELDPKVVQALYMATIEWALESAQKGRPSLDDEAISKMFGLGRNGFITEEMRRAAYQGENMQSAMQTISRKLEQLLGVKANNKISSTRTQGIMKGMAANALSIMERTGQIEKLPAVKYKTQDGQDASMVMVRVSDAVKNHPVIKEMGMPDVFTQVFTPGYSKAMYVGTAPESVSPTKLGNKLNRLSKLEKAVVRQLQQIPAYINTPFMDLIETMGEENYKTLLGFQQLDPEKTNKVRASSQEGKNQSLNSAILGIRAYFNEAKMQADQSGQDVGEIPIFHDWRISSVGRAQQQGVITQQGDKTAREFMPATWSTLDLTNESDRKAFWLAVAQSLDISLEKQPHAASVAEAQALVGNELASAVEALRSWLQNGELDADALMKIKDIEGLEVTPKVIHALLAVAQYENAKGTEQEQSFRTALAIEADGKTDGPINAMVHMTTGAFTDSQVERLAKGGLFFTSQTMSLSEFMAREKRVTNEKHKDLYEVAAELFDTNLRQTVANGLTPSQYDTLLFLNSFLEAFSVGYTEEGKISKFEIGRNITKNPLTVFLYGSGISGISNKITNAALDNMYEMLSDLAQGADWKTHPKFQENPELRDVMVRIFGAQTMQRMLQSPAEFEVTKGTFQALSGMIEETFAEPMLDAVNEATNGLAANMQIMQAASQFQTYAFQVLLQRNMDKRLAEKRKAGELTETELLSEEDMMSVFKETNAMAPIYETDEQEFHIAAMIREKTNRSVSKALVGEYEAKGETFGAADPSVKVSPYLTIGTGDGRMILNIYSTEDGSMHASLENSLPVFDGVELAAENAIAGSRKINEAVFKGWTGSNNFRAVADGFWQMSSVLDQSTIDTIDLDNQRNIRKVLGLKKSEALTVGSVLRLQRTLEILADQVDARKAAMAQMATQTDHMAGAEAPFANGTVTTESDDPTSYAEIAEKLNDLAREYMENLRQEQAEEREARVVQEPTEALATFVEEVGQPVPGYENVRQVNGRTLFEYIKNDPDLSPEQKSLAREVLGNASLQNSVYYFGDVEALTAVRDGMYDMPNVPIEYGQFSFVNGAGVAFISNVAPETVLHEMLHEHTFKSLVDYYKNPDQAPQVVKDAVVRLEELMNLTESMNVDSSAVRRIQEELSQHQNPAVKMTEFISWMLSNQGLIEVAKKKKFLARVADMIKAGLNALKDFLGIKGGPGETLFSNIRFNTQILVADLVLLQPVNAANQDAETTAVLRQAYPGDARLELLENKFVHRLRNHIEAQRKATPNLARNDMAKAKVAQLRRNARQAAELAIAAGYKLNPRQAHVFESIHMAMMSGMKLDPSLMRQLNTVFGHVIKDIDATDFFKARGQTENFDPNEFAEANEKAGFLQSRDGLRKLANGRSDLLATFMALSQVDESLRETLSFMAPPKAVEVKWDSVDNFLRSIANSVIALLTRLSFKRRTQSSTVTAELDLLADGLSELQADRRYLATSKIFEGIDKANDFVAEGLSAATTRSLDWIGKQEAKTQDKRVLGALGVAKLVASWGDQTASQSAGDSLTQLLNSADGLHPLRELLRDLRGLTEANKPLLRMVNQVKAYVDAIRQDYREKVPEELASRFSRKLHRREWTQLFNGLAKTDMLVFGRRSTITLLKSEANVDKEVSAKVEEIQKLGGNFASRYLEKANALAEYMINGHVISSNLLPNAKAIARLVGERGSDWKKIDKQVTPKLIKAIDELTSLYAYKKLDRSTKAKIEDLLTTEPDGMQDTIGFLNNTRDSEIARLGNNDVAELNGWKGYIPSVIQEGASIIVADDKDQEKLVRRGYVRIGNYFGDGAEGYRGRRGYYQSTVSGRNRFSQGVAQTVHQTWQGVDARDGTTYHGTGAGVVVGAKAERLARRVKYGAKNNLRPGEYLIPRFNEDGEIVRYERSMDPNKMKALNHDTHLGRMLGVWAGRIVEESAAGEFNRELIKTLKDIYEREKLDVGYDPKAWVNIADPKQKDAVVRDAWNTLGWKIKQDAAEIFGEPNFVPVRKDMVDDAIGYRAASLTDPFTGISRWSEETQKAMEKTLVRVMGRSAYKWLAQTNQLVNDAVSYAKTTIVVRSVIVAWQNLFSNVLQLANRGINPIWALAKMREKFIEITEYVKNREQIGALKVDLAANYGNTVERLRVEAEIQALEDANKDLTITPLLEAGEFSTISENLTEADVAIREGRWADFMEKITDRLPDVVSTGVKNVLITKDTALFQGLNRMVQYGDFIAKAVLYEHLTEKKKMDKRQALDEVLEEYVQYNRLPGRSRDFLENMGLLWFFNYKLRIQKIMAKMLRERPVSSLFVMGGVGPALEADTLWSGSLTGAIADGGISYAIGPEMGVQAAALNPWVNLPQNLWGS